MNDLDTVELRIVGCLLEKQRTTPDTYPLTLNALRLACNQATNRDPVLDLDEETIQQSLQRLHRRELTRVASGHGSRSSKYRHLVSETLGLDEGEQAVLCILLLRGDQTPGEINTRVERLHEFDGIEDVEQTLGSLAERSLVSRLERRPGEKQARYHHLLGAGEGETDQMAEVGGQRASEQLHDLSEDLDQPAQQSEIEALRREIDDLRSQVALLRERVEG